MARRSTLPCVAILWGVIIIAYILLVSFVCYMSYCLLKEYYNF